MGCSAGGGLAAAVSNGGGLGLSAPRQGDRDWLARELPIVAGVPPAPGVSASRAGQPTSRTVEFALTYRPRAVMLSFGDPAPFAEPIRAGRARR